MVEQKKILFDTIYKTEPDSTTVNIELTSEKQNPNTLPVILNLSDGDINVNNVNVKQCELCLCLKNDLRDISWELNNEGELVVNAEDAENYSVDENGDLIYTYR